MCLSTFKLKDEILLLFCFQPGLLCKIVSRFRLCWGGSICVGGGLGFFFLSPGVVTVVVR